MDDLVPWPTALPRSLWPTLIDALRGNLPDKALAAKLLWHCSGFGLGSYFGDPKPVFGSGSEMSASEAANALEAATGFSDSGVGGLPWARIAQAALKLLLELLGS